MVMLPFSLRLRLRALASVGLGLCAGGGRDASEPEPPVAETASALPADTCRSDPEAAGYTFITERPFATNFEPGRLSDDWFLSIDLDHGSPLHATAEPHAGQWNAVHSPGPPRPRTG